MPWTIHSCKLCSYRSKSLSVMYRHVLFHGTRSRTDTFICESKTLEMFECESCEFSTNLQVDLTEHFHVFHEGKGANEEMENILQCYRCEKCDFESHSILIFGKHVDDCNPMLQHDSSEEEKKHLTGEKLTKYSDGSMKPRAKSQRYEIKYSRGIKLYNCKHCAYKTKFKSNILRHTVGHPNSEEQGTTSKQSTFTNCSMKPESRLKETKLLQTEHDDQRCFKCKYCTYKTPYKNNISSHVFAKHTNPENINWLKCDQCDFKIKYKNSLNQHSSNMHESESYVKWQLKNHTAQIHGVPEETIWFEQCKQCPFKTGHSKSLEYHVKTQHTSPENFFECDKCAFKCKRIVQLKAHVISKHLNPNQINWFKCAQCSYQSKFKHNVKAHNQRVHAKPEDIIWFKCNKCKYRSKYSHHLKAHFAKQHGNLDDIQWFKCKSQSKTRGDLKVHTEETHYPQQIDWLSCPHCLFQSKRRCILRNHILRKHPCTQDTGWFWE